MKKNTILTIAGILVAGAAVYFGIKFYQKRQENKNQIPDPPTPPTPPNENPTDLNPQVVANPFITVEEIKAFQDWLDNKYPTWANGKKLNKGSGYGNYGPLTKAAYTKYGAEYLASLKPFSLAQLTESQYKNMTTIIYYGTGPKSEEAYILASIAKHPSYSANWAQAIRQRIDSGGKQGTTFIFANQIYESFSGNRIFSSRLSNKKPSVKSGAFIRQEAKWKTTTEPVSQGTNLGQIKGYFYNKNDKALFVYVPNNSKSSLLKWIWVGSITV